MTASLLKTTVSSQYSGRSQQCCNLDGFHSSSNFQFLQSFSYCTKITNYNWYNCHLHVPNASIMIGIIVTSMFHSFFNSLARSRLLLLLLLLLNIIIITYSLEFFTSALADGLSLEFE